MSSLPSRIIEELSASPQVHALLRMLLACRATAIHQVVKFWDGSTEGVTLRKKKEAVKRQVNLLIKAGFLKSYDIPILWPPVLGTEPRFQFTRGDSPPTFSSLADSLRSGFPSDTLPRRIKVLCAGERVDELAQLAGIANPFDPPFLLKVIGEDRTIWGNHQPVIQQCEREQAENERLVSDANMHRRDLCAILSDSFISRLLSLTELYINSSASPGISVDEWYTVCDLEPDSHTKLLPTPIAVNSPDPSIRATFVYSSVDSSGRLILGRPVHEDDCRAGMGFHRANTAITVVRGTDPSVLEAFHEFIMADGWTVLGVTGYRYAYNTYQIW